MATTLNPPLLNALQMIVHPVTSRSLRSSERDVIRESGKGACRLCDRVYDPHVNPPDVVIAHITPRTPKEDHQLLFLRQAGVVNDGYNKLSPSNLMLLCSTHHTMYDDGCIVFLPSIEEVEERTAALKEGRDVNEQAFHKNRYLLADVVLSATAINESALSGLWHGSLRVYHQRLLEGKANWFPQKIYYDMSVSVYMEHAIVEHRSYGNALELTVEFDALPALDPYALMRKAYYTLGRHEYPEPQLILRNPDGVEEVFESARGPS
ncbi:hypothetical protein PYCCODRAFT_1457603 [Trametes coccinea BRFM310]|uniref:HNH nuclease domain-containing protein n=1 Tax=Trametes coccinea (strain BRFM310) TaxID=1353009 RepID=A0A1Y2IVJ7_TRAC3|nr:hypothetical protein PYCCODRAFT_1457603 [Trametes coccinea BRFM310]